MYQNQWFLSLFPSKRQFMLALLFEIPSGGLIKAVFRESVGRTTAVWKRRQTVHSGVAGWVYYGIRVKKPREKDYLLAVRFTRQRPHRTAKCSTSLWVYVIFLGWGGKHLFFFETLQASLSKSLLSQMIVFVYEITEASSAPKPHEACFNCALQQWTIKSLPPKLQIPGEDKFSATMGSWHAFLQMSSK